MVFNANVAIVLTPETPKNPCGSARTFRDRVALAFTAVHMSASAQVRIDAFIYPGEFGTDFVY